MVNRRVAMGRHGPAADQKAWGLENLKKFRPRIPLFNNLQVKRKAMRDTLNGGS